MKILVTGAYGQLGNELNCLTSEYPEWQFVFADIDTLDITNEESVKVFFEKKEPDFVINCAAYTAVDKAENDADTAEIVNAEASRILGKCSKNAGAKLIHVSTDYVFDGSSSKPYVEADNVNPQSIYGKTKLLGEQLCINENPETVIIRTSWLYSAFGNNFVKTMLRLGAERGKLNVVFDQVGTPTYAADLANAILAIIELCENEPKRFIPGVYHYSNEGVASWFDFAKAIFEISEVKCIVSPVRSVEFPTPAKRPEFSVLDKSKIKTTFGLEIPYWKDSLITCVEKLKR